MVVNKDYKYYKGEEKNPYPDNPQRGFWNIERYHHLKVDHEGEWLKQIVGVFAEDLPELPFWKQSQTTKEVVALALQSMYEGGYTDIKNEIMKYGDS